MQKADVVASEELLRGHVYRLLARLLSAPPDRNLLSECAGFTGDTGNFGGAVKTLAAVAARINTVSAAREYHDLFIGVGRGELVPFESYYLTGFLQEKPLAKLRQDMLRLGIARRAAVSDPEDHAASVLEMMGGLADGSFGPVSLVDQKTFYSTHIGSWMGVFARDLEAAQASVLYAAVGSLLAAFLAIEDSAFAML